jgi:hypothetical protein
MDYQIEEELRLPCTYKKLSHLGQVLKEEFRFKLIFRTNLSSDKKQHATNFVFTNLH